MNKNECMFSLHNTDTTKEIITAAVNAFCDLKTDACMTIDLNFERCIRLNSLQDTYSRVNIEVLKAEDYRVPNNNIGKWNDEDQVWISNNGKNGRNGGGSRRSKSRGSLSADSTNNSSTKLMWKKSEYVAKHISKKPEINITDVKKYKAKLWELPSGEFYAVRFWDAPKRKLNFRKSATDVRTAQEVPAVREKGCNTNDLTDNDSTVLKSDKLSKETAAGESKSPRNPRASAEAIEELKKKITPPKEVSSRKKLSERKPLEDYKPTPKVEEKAPVEEKEKEPAVEESKSRIEESEKEKSVDNKSANTTSSPMCSPPAVFVPSIRRRADAGHLHVVEIINGVTKFNCEAKHLHRKKLKSESKKSRRKSAKSLRK